MTIEDHRKNLEADMAPDGIPAARARLALHLIHGEELTTNASFCSYLALVEAGASATHERWNFLILQPARDISEAVRIIRNRETKLS